MANAKLERRINIGLIVSTEFIQKIRQTFDSSLLDIHVAKVLADWCIEYFDKYGEAPGSEIQTIYEGKLNDKAVTQKIAEEIEDDVLPSLNEEYLEKGINADHLLRRTRDYLRRKRLERHKERIEEQIEEGNVEQAEQMMLSYEPVTGERHNELDLRSEDLPDRLQYAFQKTYEPVVWYPGPMGDMLNEHLVRGGFVGLMAGEKVGKTLMLLDMAVRAMRQGKRVAFFQAGDMTEDQQLMRMAIYLAKKSNKPEYTGKMHRPVRDCMWNQLDECDLDEREVDFGIFKSTDQNFEDYHKWKNNKENLIEAKKNNPDYSPCSNCKYWRYNKWGVSWLKEEYVDGALEYEEALQKVNGFLERNKGEFKLATYDNGTLTVPTIEGRLNLWEKEEGFVADLILVDYADLLVSDKYNEFRHKQNDVWASLRGLSQSKHALVVAPTQADAKSYESGLLKLSNFSEDKRKYSHVTYMAGLNRDPSGYEKELGLMRINDLVAREGEFNNARQVYVIQNLSRGRPVLGSFWGPWP